MRSAVAASGAPAESLVKGLLDEVDAGIASARSVLERMGYDPKQVSAIANPDNITFDSRGNLWISTDGQPGVLGMNDSIYAVPTEGPERGFNRRLLSAVKGAA